MDFLINNQNVKIFKLYLTIIFILFEPIAMSVDHAIKIMIRCIYCFNFDHTLQDIVFLIINIRPPLFQATGFQGKDKDYYWKFFSVLGGIYGFFLFETTANLLLRQTHTVEVEMHEF
jgi:hypothetical protein